MSLRSRRAILLLSFIAIAPGDAAAANRFWSGGLLGGGQFTDPDSWFNGVPTNNITSDVAVFYGFLGGPINTTVNLSTSRSVQGLFFDRPEGLGSAIDFTLIGSTLSIGAGGIDIDASAGGNQTINNNIELATTALSPIWDIGKNLRINGVVSGTDTLFKNGAATLTLAASNTHTGDLLIFDGTVLVSGAGRLSDRSDVTVNAGATLRFDGMTDAINGLFGYNGGGTVDLQDTATLVIGNSINNSQGVGDFPGTIQGTGGQLIKRGPGTFRLTGDNTYTGGTRVESGILLIENSSLTSATGPGAVTVAAGGSLGGSGTAEGTVTVQAGGAIFPGGDGVASSDRTDLLTTIGMTLDAGATFKIDLGGSTPGETYDVLAAFNASLAGSLEVNLVNGFTPSNGQVFQILVATGSRTGTFAGLPQGALVGEFGGVELTIDYTEGSGRIVSLQAGLPGDFNGNAAVDAADYVVWRNGLGAKYSQDDYNIWRTHFGQTTGTGAASNAAVPEPTSALLILSSAVMGAWMRYCVAREIH